MHSFIIVTKDKKTAEEYIKSLCQKQDISLIDRHFVLSEGSIGIKDIRSLQKDLFLTPVKSKTKAIIIQNGEKLTIEAQNALLKTLEEPPDNTIIIITAQNKNVFLPTVVSRCQVILLDKNSPKIEHDTNFSVAAAAFDAVIARSRSDVEDVEDPGRAPRGMAIFQIGERLAYAQSISKTKEDALAWLEQSILSLRKDMLETSHMSSGKTSLAIYIRELQKAHVTLSTTNVQPRFIIENLLLSI